MSKPSIFSRDYDRKMKARRRRKTILLTSIILIALAALVTISFQNWLQNNAGSLKRKKDYLTENNISSKTDNSGKENSKETDEQNKSEDEVALNPDKTLDVKFPDNKTAQLIYTEEGSNKKIKQLVPTDNGNLIYSINPSSDKAVVLASNQDMYIVDTNGVVSNITKDKYVSTKSGNVIIKSDYLAKKPDFIWHGSPMFINDTTVAYITQMPWFKTTKYIYKVDINSINHDRVFEVEGENVTFGILNEKGLTVNVDGAVKYISPEGKIIQ